MNRVHKFALAAILTLAVALTLFGCASTSSTGGGGYSSAESVKIGNQVWMAKNLNYDVAGSRCYNDDPSYCYKYGRLYDWETAKTICPSGWHLPTKEEWEGLVSFVGGREVAGKNLKAVSGWKENGNGTDNFGFAALPGGEKSNNFSFGGAFGYWWSASDVSFKYGNASSVAIYYNEDKASIPYDEKSVMHSVRCISDNSSGYTGNTYTSNSYNSASANASNSEGSESSIDWGKVLDVTLEVLKVIGSAFVAFAESYANSTGTQSYAPQQNTSSYTPKSNTQSTYKPASTYSTTSTTSPAVTRSEGKQKCPARCNGGKCPNSYCRGGYRSCLACNGDGTTVVISGKKGDSGKRTCTSCGGSGKKECSDCHGSGKCSRCNGKGEV